MATIDTGVTADSIRTRISEIQTAIQAALLTGQTVGRLGLNLTRVPIETLRKMELSLRGDLIKMSSEGPVNVFSYTNSTGVGGNTEQDWNNQTF